MFWQHKAISYLEIWATFSNILNYKFAFINCFSSLYSPSTKFSLSTNKHITVIGRNILGSLSPIKRNPKKYKYDKKEKKYFIHLTSKISHLDNPDLFLLAKRPIIAIFWASTSLWAAYALNPDKWQYYANSIHNPAYEVLLDKYVSITTNYGDNWQGHTRQGVVQVDIRCTSIVYVNVQWYILGWYGP